MSKKLQEAKELLNFGLTLGEVVDKSLADGKINFGDVTHLMSLFSSARAAFDGAKEGLELLKNPTSEEFDQLKSYVEAEFDLRNDKIEYAVEAAIKVALNVYEVVLSFIKK